MTTIAPPSPLPEFVYKITPTAPPDPIPEAYPLSDLDRQDGFVHLSTAWQIPITADLFFTSTPEFWILKLRLANFAPASVKWDETPGTNGCPHLYGNFGAADIVGARRFARGPDGQSWRDTLQAEAAWLE
ncbi:hypothetical protein B0T26DRAFT_738776 [Lasiosphaeria miniovina]|uniref:DUF952 domain-containing protein n=1 Tax=Lasiosphaeria miniovina TaxID=1954250 RepID=A0AA40B654_9PEZI|nr:uncharacterized protein B0T26DRAFT_738776 [Lasiosphaeria miniovina]KAK0728429.1 hypothetical protein B0T26DRAFT_738776 [Lasiosphaeria miniovina]